MNLVTFVTLLGTLTIKEHCLGFSCKLSKRFNQTCRLSFNGERANILGMSAEVKQFMWGPTEGFHGRAGNQTITLFFEKKRIKKALVAEYSTPDEYDRWTCIF